MDDLPGVHPSPNIQGNPDIYELENLAADPEQRIEAAMMEIAPWTSKTVLDLGAGTGFHIAHFHPLARHVFAIEPHDASRLRAMARMSALGLERTSVMKGSAEQILLPDQSVDIVHARFAYFFAPYCEQGLSELARVIRPNGTAFIIDNDLSNGTFASWLKRSRSQKGVTGEQVEKWWAEKEFSLRRIPSEWCFEKRADLEAVVHNNFPAQLARQILLEHNGIRVDYWYCLYYRHY